MMDLFGDRMKTYESVPKNFLMRRTPVIIRIDGKAFHSFTGGFDKPFDEILMDTMNSTMKYLCENIQGCVLGYTQSDEISLLLVDYKTITTDAWFSNNVQKIVSVSASMATAAFNEFFCKRVDRALASKEIGYQDFEVVYSKKTFKAMFDARAFNLPKEEVCNYFIWRQKDATRNSIQAVGQFFFSQNQLHRKSSSDIQEMLFSEYGVNWSEDYSTSEKRGTCCVKAEDGWCVDTEIPVFTSDRAYIDRFVYIESEGDNSHEK